MDKSTKTQNVEPDEALKEKAIDLDIDEKVTNADIEDWQNLHQGIMDDLHVITDLTTTLELTHPQRMRLNGSGVRRYGFIDKLSDIMGDYPALVPQAADLNLLKNYVRLIEVQRNINVALRQLTRINMDNLLISGNEAFRISLMIYNTVHQMARSRVPGAAELFEQLRMLFRRHGSSAAEPTEAEIERDVRALIKGRKEGTVEVSNRNPEATERKRVMMDDTSKSKKNGFRETESGEIDE